MMIPGTDILANVAAKNPIAHSLPQRFGNGLAEFNGEVADAATAVQYIRCNERIGRAGVETCRTRTTVVGLLGWIVVEFHIGEQGGQKKPTAGLSIEEQTVFTNPAQAGPLGKLAFQQGRRIDHSPYACGGNRSAKRFCKQT